MADDLKFSTSEKARIAALIACRTHQAQPDLKDETAAERNSDGPVQEDR